MHRRLGTSTIKFKKVFNSPLYQSSEIPLSVRYPNLKERYPNELHKKFYLLQILSIQIL
jgi:hypothetical protein